MAETTTIVPPKKRRLNIRCWKSILRESLEDSEEDGRISPDSRCAICLGRLQKISLTDTCLHPFCYNCLLKWSQVKPECPLCKGMFKSIIYNVRSEDDYDQIDISQREQVLHLMSYRLLFGGRSNLLSIQDLSSSSPVVELETPPRRGSTRERFVTWFNSWSSIGRRRTQHERNRFPSIDPLLPDPDLEFEVLDSSSLQGVRDHQEFFQDGRNHVTRQVRRWFVRNRSEVYSFDLWAVPLMDVSRSFRTVDCIYFRENVAQLNRAAPWINRELLAIPRVENAPPIDVALEHVMHVLKEFQINTRSFFNAIFRYIGRYSEHFMHELYIYLRCLYDMPGYDRNVTYAVRETALRITSLQDPNYHPFLAVGDVQIIEGPVETIDLLASESEPEVVVLSQPPKTKPEVVVLSDSDGENPRPGVSCTSARFLSPPSIPLGATSCIAISSCSGNYSSDSSITTTSTPLNKKRTRLRSNSQSLSSSKKTRSYRISQSSSCSSSDDSYRPSHVRRKRKKKISKLKASDSQKARRSEKNCNSNSSRTKSTTIPNMLNLENKVKSRRKGATKERKRIRRLSITSTCSDYSGDDDNRNEQLNESRNTSSDKSVKGNVSKLYKNIIPEASTSSYCVEGSAEKNRKNRRISAKKERKRLLRPSITCYSTDNSCDDNHRNKPVTDTKIYKFDNESKSYSSVGQSCKNSERHINLTTEASTSSDYVKDTVEKKRKSKGKNTRRMRKRLRRYSITSSSTDNSCDDYDRNEQNNDTNITNCDESFKSYTTVGQSYKNNVRNINVTPEASTSSNYDEDNARKKRKSRSKSARKEKKRIRRHSITSTSTDSSFDDYDRNEQNSKSKINDRVESVKNYSSVGQTHKRNVRNKSVNPEPSTSKNYVEDTAAGPTFSRNTYLKLKYTSSSDELG